MNANCSAHRPPTEMVLYFLERPCPDNFKKYKIISVGGLWAEQFAIKNDRFYRENRKLRIYQNAKFAKSTKKLVNFDCELLGSQTTHRNGFVLFEIVRARPFQKVQHHFCGWSVGWTIRDQTWRDFIAKFLETPIFWVI